MKTPNDLKLSDRRGWRDRCVVGGKAAAEAAGVTAAPVRCSAWLGVAVIGMKIPAPVNAAFVIGWIGGFVCDPLLQRRASKREGNTLYGAGLTGKWKEKESFAA